MPPFDIAKEQTYARFYPPVIANVFSLKFWSIWLFALLLVSIALALIMDVAPYLHGDEFMIVDLGRNILQSDSNWSITWIVEREEPAFVFFYLGPVLQEFVYQVLGQYGPRISGILGALVAATVMVGWLLTRNTSKYVALILGLVFLLDPLFVQSYTLGRLDGWSMAFCLASCVSLRSSKYKKKVYPNVNVGREFALAGILAAIAFFIWPSAVFLYPLIISEVYCAAAANNRFGISNNVGYKKSVNTRLIKVFFTAAILTALTLLLPILPQLYSLSGNIVEGLVVNLHSGTSSDGNAPIHFSAGPLLELLRGLKFTPILLLFAPFGAVLRKDLQLIFSGLAAVILMLLTVVYIHRVLYLLPYLIAIVAGIFERGETNTLNRKCIITLMLGAITWLLAWAICISLIARTVLALDDKAARDRTIVFQAAKEMIGPGKHAVYLPGPEFYLAGRALGWEMFRRYAAVGDPLSPEKLYQVIPRLDYIIMPSREETAKFNQQLVQAGFKDMGWYQVYNEAQSVREKEKFNANRLRNLFSIPKQPYGPYKLYARVRTDFPPQRSLIIN